MPQIQVGAKSAVLAHAPAHWQNSEPESQLGAERERARGVVNVGTSVRVVTSEVASSTPVAPETMQQLRTLEAAAQGGVFGPEATFACSTEHRGKVNTKSLTSASLLLQTPASSFHLQQSSSRSLLACSALTRSCSSRIRAASRAPRMDASCACAATTLSSKGRVFGSP